MAETALHEFESFPDGARSICLAALTIAAEGGKADIAKPMHGLGFVYLKSRWRSRAMHFASFMPCSWRLDLRGPRLPEEIAERHQEARWEVFETRK
jgi:hypothetical protein